MTRLSDGAADKRNDAADTTAKVMSNVTITSEPVVITAVQRKANIGNYENIDIYVGLAIPQTSLDLTNKEALQQGLMEAVEFGMSIAARETADRYHKIKDSLKTH
jgi:hypothetical protein